MTYSINKYRLDYTIWAAYRAAQAGSAKAKGAEFTNALKKCGVIEYINSYENSHVTQDEFNKLHKCWCNSVISRINKDISYGIAAKLIGVFLKGYYILANNEKQPLSDVIHPAIDSFLLEGIDAKNGTNFSKCYKWQKLDETEYFKLFNKLQKQLKLGDPLWHLEKFWVLK